MRVLKRMPSLYSLQVFDAVADRLSFTRAAEDLNITQGAVSYQVKQLEADMGVPLLIRGNRGTSLSPAGQALAPKLRRALADIHSIVEEISHDPGARLVVSLTTYFAARWLLPRLSTFMRAHPDLEVRLVHAAGGNQSNLGDADVAIRWGKTDSERDAELIFKSGLTPVCSPTLLGRGITDAGPLDIGHSIIQHDDEMRGAWADWLALAQISDHQIVSGPVIPDPNVRMEAVIDGQGYALGDALVLHDIDNGKLVAPSDVYLHGYGYFLIKANARSKVASDFQNWLTNEAAIDRDLDCWAARDRPNS
jgi:DNA-binding transcriptional LysR family regulator